MSQSPDRAVTILARFNAAQNSLAAKLRDLPAHVAEERDDIDAWTAAQIGWHVATTNDWIAGVLIGTTPMAEPAAPGFRETLHMHPLPQRVKTAPVARAAGDRRPRFRDGEAARERSAHVEGDRIADAGARRRLHRDDAVRHALAVRARGLCGGPHRAAYRPD